MSKEWPSRLTQPSLPPTAVGLLQDGDVVSQRGQPGRGRQTAEPGAHHDDPGHAPTVAVRNASSGGLRADPPPHG